MRKSKNKNEEPLSEGKSKADSNVESGANEAQSAEDILGATFGDTPTEELADERTPLEKAEDERDEYLANWQRAKADYQNLRRRILDDIDAAVQREARGLMQEMLTVLDYLDMALASPCESQDSKNLQIGVQMTRTHLWQGLERQGVKVIPTVGIFDPALHQAMATIESTEVAAGTIMEVVRAGFQKQDFVLRHAQVKVAAFPDMENNTEGQDSSGSPERA